MEGKESVGRSGGMEIKSWEREKQMSKCFDGFNSKCKWLYNHDNGDGSFDDDWRCEKYSDRKLNYGGTNKYPLIDKRKYK